MVALRAKVLDLHQAMQPLEGFDPPALTGEEHEQAAEYFDLDTLRGTTGAQGPRERLHVTAREKLNAEEATLAAELRAEQEACDKNFTVAVSPAVRSGSALTLGR